MKKISLKLSLITFFAMFSVSTFAQNAKLVAYRKGGPYGILAKYKVNVDGNEVGILKPNSVVQAELTPGQHIIAPKQGRRAITINAEAGKTYVVKFRNMLGIFGVRPKLKEVTLEEAKEDSKKVAKI